MLTLLRQFMRSLSCTPFHPQWLANRGHKKKLNCLHEIKESLALDIGSGLSNIKLLLDKSNRVITTDYPSTSTFYGNLPDIYLDARSLPFSSASVDVIFFFEVIEHIDNTDQVLYEIMRVLKPGGRLFISVPFLYPEHDMPYDFYRFTREGMKHVIHRAGLIVGSAKPIAVGIDAILLLNNLYILLLARKIESRLGLFVLPFAVIAYVLCIMNNLLAVIIEKIVPKVDEIYLGQSIEAKKPL